MTFDTHDAISSNIDSLKIGPHLLSDDVLLEVLISLEGLYPVYTVGNPTQPERSSSILSSSLPISL
jgi:hypothetical protein